MEYYDGQILKNAQEHKDFANWTNSHGNKFGDTANGDGTYTVYAIPPAPAPTREDIEKARIEYRREHIDDETLCRLRKQANGTWTQEMEDAYLALDAEVTAYIEEHLPYPTDPIFAENTEINSVTNAEITE